MRYTIIISLCLPLFLSSQQAPKFSKISDLEKEIQKTEITPDANAIILSDYSEIDFLGTEDSKFV